MPKIITKTDQVNIKMPRPATPKPGFSLLRLNNSKKPHNIASLSTQAKINLINSIAQDIEGCIWAVGHYVKLGVLDSTHTLGFDQVLNDIYKDERSDNEEVLLWALRSMERYKKQARAERKRAKRLDAKLRRERGEEQGNGDHSDDENPIDSDSSTAYPEMKSMKRQGLQSSQGDQTQDVADTVMTSPPPSPTQGCMDVDGSSAPF
ncbi:hypothetical protein TSTA_082410 [Talaromyces stipitatus ATCC 10500]|uniref:Uncharacterized protein n=1 Tax=Talaromyces stipitatus (strain ATCC 10500 / CBS 375.48 / QM 6759 / NRRL 1006) TaxID=441959 RepID=B8M166_TALSN|nr:uncharacterized protein TSTA_082410 [Talaromyces stipitatus ATCC 10500]EED21008.1 hypothetical protein TSTA_082410 [Talaromyces stipitatus ATCC 10500]